MKEAANDREGWKSLISACSPMLAKEEWINEWMALGVHIITRSFKYIFIFRCLFQVFFVVWFVCCFFLFKRNAVLFSGLCLDWSEIISVDLQLIYGAVAKFSSQPKNNTLTKMRCAVKMFDSSPKPNGYFTLTQTNGRCCQKLTVASRDGGESKVAFIQ